MMAIVSGVVCVSAGLGRLGFITMHHSVDLSSPNFTLS